MSQGITLARAMRVFQGELGCSYSGTEGREYLIDSIQEAVEHMLYNGGGEILREWIVDVRGGKFTFPRDLETPIKWKCGTDATLGFGTIHSRYYGYSSQSIQNCCGYSDWGDLNLQILPNKVATEYAPPKTGLRLVATTRYSDDIGKKIMVNGTRCDNPVLPTHNNYKTAGELLTIYHEDDPDKKYGAWVFDDITGVIKDETCAYTMLSGVDPNNGCWYFLSHYTPDETVPRYTEGFLHQCHNCKSCDFQLHILGRIAPNIRYIRDEDILPISSFEILKLLAKRARYDQSGDFNEVVAIEQRLQVAIKKQVAYQQAANRHLSFALGASGATLTNI